MHLGAQAWIEQSGLMLTSAGHLLIAALLPLALADVTLELNGESAYIEIDQLYTRSVQYLGHRFYPSQSVVARLPSAQFSMAAWVYPTPGLKTGLGTVFAMNTATGGNVFSLAVDRATNQYVYKVRRSPLRAAPTEAADAIFACRTQARIAVLGFVRQSRFRSSNGTGSASRLKLAIRFVCISTAMVVWPSRS